MKPIATMNVIPFIDIMLVLLAVVLTTATFVAQGRIPVSLPDASAAQAPGRVETTEITVTRSGELFIAERSLSIEQLAEQLATLDRQTPVLLRVDEQAAFQHFVEVIDLLQSQQLGKVSILTRRGAD